MENKEIVLDEQIAGSYLYFGTVPGNEKIVVSVGKDHHYTIHFGTKSGYLDVHKTYDNSDEQPTLFRIKHYSLMRAMVYLNKVYTYGIRKYWMSKKINIGKLKKYDCILFPMTTGENKEKLFFRIKNKGRHIRFQKRIPIQELENLYVEPDEIIEHKAETFLVYSLKKGRFKQQGFVYKNFQNPTSKKLYFVTKTNFKKHMKSNAIGLFNVFGKIQFENKGVVMKHLEKNLLENYPDLAKKKVA